MRFVFVQSFSLDDVCGGARILRSVAQSAPVESVESICTGFGRAGANIKAGERLIPLRPGIGRLEHTRFHWLGGYVERLWKRSFQARLEKALLEARATDIHLVPHSWGDFEAALEVGRRLGLRIHTSIHDDFRYTASTHPFLSRLDNCLGELWREANTRFVITEEMGREYSSRYGERAWLVHTDGAECRLEARIMPVHDELRVYFMGLFLNSYRGNFTALMEALSKFSQLTGRHCRMTLRSRRLPFSAVFPGVTVDELPFTTQDVLAKEMASSDLLYLPLSFDPASKQFNRFSLSTKMVSYLASGTPIVYHGPADAAAGRYLAKNDAAFCMHTINPAEMAGAMVEALQNAGTLRKVSGNASRVAARDFDATMLRNRFWNAILNTV